MNIDVSRPNAGAERLGDLRQPDSADRRPGPLEEDDRDDTGRLSLVLEEAGKSGDHRVSPLTFSRDGDRLVIVERNLHWVTDGVYQAAFLTTKDGVVLFDAPRASGTTSSERSTKSPKRTA
jgi:hypothetical protein